MNTPYALPPEAMKQMEEWYGTGKGSTADAVVESKGVGALDGKTATAIGNIFGSTAVTPMGKKAIDEKKQGNCTKLDPVTESALSNVFAASRGEIVETFAKDEFSFFQITSEALFQEAVKLMCLSENEFSFEELKGAFVQVAEGEEVEAELVPGKSVPAGAKFLDTQQGQVFLITYDEYKDMYGADIFEGVRKAHGLRKALKEGTYSDFLSHYGNEIQKIVGKFRLLHNHKNTFTKVAEEHEEEIASHMKIYDDMVDQAFQHWVFSGRPDADMVARLGCDIQDRFGTEPRQVINAANDFFRILSKYIPELMAREEEEIDGEEDMIESRKVFIKKPIKEGAVKDWIYTRISAACENNKVPTANLDAIEDAVFGAMLSGKLGDGALSEETSRAIADMVLQLASAQALPPPPNAPTLGPVDPAAEEAVVFTDDAGVVAEGTFVRKTDKGYVVLTESKKEVVVPIKRVSVLMVQPSILDSIMKGHDIDKIIDDLAKGDVAALTEDAIDFEKWEKRGIKNVGDFCNTAVMSVREFKGLILDWREGVSLEKELTAALKPGFTYDELTEYDEMICH